ncbi:hypothetical protein AAMO2058_000107300 [Amorphochlora amoebiformis]
MAAKATSTIACEAFSRHLRQGIGRKTRGLNLKIRYLSTKAAFPKSSARIESTDVPCIVQMQHMLARYKDRPGGVASLAQGIVHWGPPEEAMEAAQKAISDSTMNLYGPVDGSPELKQAIQDKLESENNIRNSKVMVTMGANQAYTNLVIALVDSGDPTILFKPYYFNHHMCLQMTGGAHNVILGGVTPDSLMPDSKWLEKTLESKLAAGSPVKMVTIVNPCNPTGVLIPGEKLREISDICERFGTWLVVDNTYEHFTYPEITGKDNAMHECVEGDNVVNIFSFSKAYGLMGWRIGYIAFPENLVEPLVKVQDTIPICPNILAQKHSPTTWRSQWV